MRLTVAFLFLSIVGLASCEAVATGPDFSEAGFSVRARAGRLVLTNASPAPVHYVALEEEISARVDLYFDPEAWPQVAPGGEERIRYADLMGYAPGAKQARIYWWTEGQYKKHIVVDLR